MHPSTYRHSAEKRVASMLLYGPGLWIFWIAAWASCVALELLPAPGTSPTLFYLRLTLKIVCFVVLGLAIPLSLWRFDSLGLGLVVPVCATAFIEIGQRLILGHRASYLECFAKIMLIGCGLILGLNCRYERQIKVGPVIITLVDPHRSD
jgi:hypothetical protein